MLQFVYGDDAMLVPTVLAVLLTAMPCTIQYPVEDCGRVVCLFWFKLFDAYAASGKTLAELQSQHIRNLSCTLLKAGP